MKLLGRYVLNILIWMAIVGGFDAVTGYKSQGWRSVVHDCLIVVVVIIWDVIRDATRD